MKLLLSLMSMMTATIFNWNKQWPSHDIFLVWLANESKGSGSEKKYTKKHPQRSRKVETKRIPGGCTCSLAIKTYGDTPVVLGSYKPQHCHKIGHLNLMYTRIPKVACETIIKMLREGIHASIVVEKIQSGIYHNAHDEEVLLCENLIISRDV
ncbi:hypothetical protein BS47DRAFT_737869 [Hydnum rufescens UP504]|uniref:Uncharacterized protein n=1 Tax=Hydnum rufescens UP504 TaxID=1448309 RepID=A0A9P6B2B1_9AGAM|nr:hypothetical protein BS47DRAFT_737869 [Hydnum rufescens UP504]